MRRRPPLPLVLALGCFGLAFAQRPGTLVADTKVNLYVDPGRFLGDVASAWTSTGELGHVFAGQYGGYLFPMGPFYALGHATGAPMWVVHRLWIGALLALAAWGVVRLLDALRPGPRGPLHAAAAVLYVVNPYVAVYLDRTSIALLAYAALPWLLLAIHRGLREPRGWGWPAAFALLLTSTGGGVNVAVTGWLLVAPALLVVYELGWGGVGAGALRPFAARLAAACAVANAWWVVPLLVHGRYGVNFLPFTEQPGTIWSTTSVSESLRLMGFWTSYIRVGYGGVDVPFAGHGHALLFDAPIVLATLLVPALVLAGFVWTRRWRYGPFFLALTLLGVAIMAAGWPEGTPLRRALTFTYNHVQALQFLRTTYKAGPLVALGLAALGGAAFAAAWRRTRWRAPLTLACAALVAAAAWPLVSGRAPDRQLAFKVPASWRALGRDLDRGGDDTRVLSLPGQLVAFHRWGGTIDDVLPALTHRPVATRYLVPYSDLRADDLGWTTDSLISQERALPGQLPPLLDLLGVGDLVLAADGDRSQSGEVGPLEARAQLGALARRPAWASPDRVGVRPAAGRLGAPRSLPRVQRFAVRTGGLVRVLPRAGETVVDGGAEGVAQLAAFGALRPSRALRYAGDLEPAAIRAAARSGASLVVTDSNRRQAFVSSRLRGDRGPTLPVDEELSADGTFLDPFADRGTAAQTVQRLAGVAAVTAPASPQVTQFPEHRPFAAVDGDPRTAWLADRFLTPQRHRLTVRFTVPRDVPYVDLMPYDDSRAVVRSVAVGDRVFRLHRGWNRLALGLRHVRSVTVRMAEVRRPKRASAGAGGFRELRIPGVHVREALRVPELVEGALRGVRLRPGQLSYLLERTTAASPYREGRLTGEMGAGLVRDARDPEAQLRRVIAPPTAAAWRADAWATVAPGTRDDELDRLAGTRGAGAAWSSSRFEGAPRYRASGAFDGGPRAWLGEWIPGRPAWLAWRTARPVTLRRLRIVPAAADVRVPTIVRLRASGTRSIVTASVGPGGVVGLPQPMRGARFRLDIVDAAFRRGTPGWIRQRRAVGIGELRGAGLRLRVPHGGRLRAPCGAAAVTLGSRRVALRVDGTLARFDAGRPLPARACGAPVALGAGPTVVRGDAAAFTVDQLRLSSGAALSAPVAGGGRVLDAGRLGRGERTGVRVSVRGPSWLVLGESDDAGWRASCDGHGLGAPVPLQGYANGWPVGAGCRNVSFTFAPNRLVRAGYAVSVLGILALLGALLVRRRRRVHAPRAAALGDLVANGGGPLPLRRALLVAVLAAPVIGFVFSLRAGTAAAPLVALALWRGVPTRAVILAAGALLAVAVPAAYAIAGFDDREGFNTYYAVDHRVGHWLAVAAVVLLGFALARTLAARPSVRPRPAPQPRQDEDLEHDVAREPRELGELA